MLAAERLKDYDEARFFQGYASIKRNGIHAIYDPKHHMFYSRTPKILEGLDSLLKELDQYRGAIQHPLVGELVVPGTDFETCSGLIRSGQLKPTVNFHVFNYIVPKMVFIERLELLERINIFQRSSHIFLEDMAFMPSCSSFDKFYVNAVSKGEEGVCIIHPEHIYQPGKRTWNWMKRVPLKSMEVEIIGIEPGTTDKKYESSMGHMACKFFNKVGKELRVDVGIFKGQTDDWRKMIYDTRESYIGQKVTIEFKTLSKYGIPTQPRFKGFRWDL